MENASKALIIAGAILLSILLISLGIMIFNQAQDTVNNSGMTKAEISSFNSQFSKYEKSNIKGSEVKSLIQEVNVNNAQDDSNEHQVTVKLNGTELASTSVKGTDGTTDVKQYTTSGLVNTKSYTVKITGYAAKGRISTIEITSAR